MKQPDPSIKKVTAAQTPQAMVSQQTGSRAKFFLNPENPLADLSFLDFLASPENEEPLQGQIQTTQSVRQTAPSEKEKSEKATKSQNKERLPDSVAPYAALTLKAQLFSEEGDVIDSLSFGKDDLNTVVNWLNQAGPVPFVQNLSPSLIEQMPQTTYKSLQTSKGFQMMLENALKTQRPIRVSIGDNAEMILHLQKDGKVSAEFLAQTAASEMYLRQQLSELRSRLDEKNLPYASLSVRRDAKQENARKSPFDA